MASPDEITTLYHQLLDAWNRRDAKGYTAFFDPESLVVGFDGSQMQGQAAVETELSRIFADHPTASYVGKIRRVRFLSPDVAVLHAVVGMIPPGGSDLNPAANAIQSLTAAKHDDQWRIAVFQNTPAQFHGRPELAEALTDELRELLPKE